MRMKPRPVPRWPRVPLGIVGFLALWALIVALGQWYRHATGSRLDTCLFHRLTGWPCPTCGTTRGLLALARGDWRTSFAWNPLVMSGFLVAVLATAGRVLTARTLEIELSPVERRVLIGAGLMVLAVNWAWLIHSHP